MKVLIACECSGRVREAFRKLGHEAWSCDLQPSEIPSEYHIQDYVEHYFDASYGFDLMIAHPPCTDILSAGCRWFDKKIANGSQQKGIDFFMLCIRAPINMICVENPVGIMSNQFQKPTQIIQPWQFGEGECKATCFWLKNLPSLKPTHIIPIEHREHSIHIGQKGEDGTHSKFRSRTFHGISRAMANQWGNLNLEQITHNKYYFSK